MEDLYFEKNENIVRRARQTLKKIFLYSGSEDVSEYNIKRCLDELGVLCDIVERNRVIKNEILNIQNPVTNIINNAIQIVERVSSQEKKKLNSIEEFFEKYKKDNSIKDVDFGLAGFYKKRKKECVYNRAMFSRLASLRGYPQREISRILKIERSVVSHYLHYYKIPNFVHEESNSKYIRRVDYRM